MIFKREDLANIPDVIRSHTLAIRASLESKEHDGYPDLLAIGGHLNALGMLAEGLRHEFAAEIVKKNLEEADREAFVSREKREVCPVCLGHGRFVNSGLDCLECYGTGAVRTPEIPFKKDGTAGAPDAVNVVPMKDCPTCRGFGYSTGSTCSQCDGIGSIPA